MARLAAMAHRWRIRQTNATPFSTLSNLLPPSTTPKRTISQIMIVVQNSMLITLMHSSRATSPVSPRRYLASTAILLVEIIKLLVSLTIITCNTSKAHPDARRREIVRSVCRGLCSTDAWMLVIPAALYVFQNFLIYVAISNMQAVVFQATYQLKILTTVLFSVLLLRKAVSPRQWLALFVLTFGVTVVQVSQLGLPILPLVAWLRDWVALPLRHLASAGMEARTHVSASPPLGASPTSPQTNTAKGMLAAVAASITSGLTSVYFERLVKDSPTVTSLWIRNAQLAFFSIFPAAFVGVLWQDGATISRDGFFAGYSPLVWAVIGLQALGGLLVAICVIYADSIAKNFASSLSIVVSCVLGSVVFSEPVKPNSAFGVFIVLLAIYLYHSCGHHPRTITLLPVSTGKR